MNNFFYGKKVLVTGAAGFVGTNLVKKLVGVGADVRGTIFKRNSQDPVPNVEYVKADLRDSADCFKVANGVDFIFMAAANSSGAAVIEGTPLAHLTPNLVMNALMLEAAYASNVKKFCFISSNTVYPLTDFPVSETDVNNEFYEKYFIVGWMKRFSELMCQMYSEKIRSPMETIVIRPGNLYGPFDKFTIRESKVIAALIRKAVERQSPFKVWGDGLDIKDFLYIDDFIDGLLLAFQKSKRFDVINIASGIPLSISELITLILRVVDYDDAEILYDSSMPTMIPKRLISIEKARSDLNWSPLVKIDQGLRLTVDWYKNYYSNFNPEELN